ncbi:flagellin FlaB [Methanomicrobium sp. W14]|uniref:archaellin/type IV pilin N-terminal domain-containing protein n=1 Tax=Methanomicrobium sp. W14 TaxID=2817839 RepID=UPI001AE41BE1|nr:archaellin/type IV pilin N-terminal domain-containing protein [Methanomicrobium sp. W14]MBP2133823.1 flagellin FlaB [Methanomicrobium sp. W14]
MGNKDENSGFTGLEAALILIAFVVVASVFSYVILNAGFFAVQKSQQVIYSAVEQSSSVVIAGDTVKGLKNSTTGKIDRIIFSLSAPYALLDVNLNSTSVSFMTDSLLKKIDKASPLYNSSEPSPGTWSIISNTGGPSSGTVLSTGKSASLMINLPPDAQISPGDNFRVNVLLTPGPSVAIDKKAPAGFDDTVVM